MPITNRKPASQPVRGSSSTARLSAAGLVNVAASIISTGAANLSGAGVDNERLVVEVVDGAVVAVEPVPIVAVVVVLVGAAVVVVVVSSVVVVVEQWSSLIPP